jgi:predicted Zn-dependent protease with MMP-like domain
MPPREPLSFDEHVRAALDSIPPNLAKALDNVAVVVETQNREEPDLYGLFDWPEYMPAKISIYRKPLEEDFPNAAELEEQIRITVLHELAHYFGFEEDRIADLGYD